MAHKTLFALVGLALYLSDAGAQSLIATNAPSKTTSRNAVAEGPDVWGVFDGRVRCQEMASVMKVAVPANCETLKWSFTFYQHPGTHEPTTYVLRGSLYRDQPRKGKWVIVKGIHSDPDAAMIQLDPDHPDTSLYLLKGDDNVLFILNGNKELMVGDTYLSYTFNRTTN
jgi:hypothetical protein